MISAKVLNAILFQAGWLACVAGGNAWALPAGALILALHGWLVERSARGWAFMVLAALLGLAMDLGWQRLGLLEFHGTLGACRPVCPASRLNSCSTLPATAGSMRTSPALAPRTAATISSPSLSLSR